MHQQWQAIHILIGREQKNAEQDDQPGNLCGGLHAGADGAAFDLFNDEEGKR
jgi:hypothetical protein